MVYDCYFFFFFFTCGGAIDTAIFIFYFQTIIFVLDFSNMCQKIYAGDCLEIMVEIKYKISRTNSAFTAKE